MINLNYLFVWLYNVLMRKGVENVGIIHGGKTKNSVIHFLFMRYKMFTNLRLLN